jgi:hypothetical protein
MKSDGVSRWHREFVKEALHADEALFMGGPACCDPPCHRNCGLCWKVQSQVLDEECGSQPTLTPRSVSHFEVLSVFQSNALGEQLEKTYYEC